MIPVATLTISVPVSVIHRHHGPTINYQTEFIYRENINCFPRNIFPVYIFRLDRIPRVHSVVPFNNQIFQQNPSEIGAGPDRVRLAGWLGENMKGLVSVATAVCTLEIPVRADGNSQLKPTLWNSLLRDCLNCCCSGANVGNHRRRRHGPGHHH